MGDYTKLITTSTVYGCYNKDQMRNLKNNVDKSVSTPTSVLVGIVAGFAGVLYKGVVAIIAFASGTAFPIVDLAAKNSISNKLQDYIDEMNNNDFALLGLECKITYTPMDLKNGTYSDVEVLRVKKFKNLGNDPMSDSEIRDYIEIQMT